MPSPITFGVYGSDVDTGRVLYIADVLQPRGALVMDHIGLAVELSQRNILTMFRKYWPWGEHGDDGLFEVVDAITYLRAVFGMLGNNRQIVVTLGNEPYWGWDRDRKDRIKRWAAWTLEGMKFARDEGWRLCVGNLFTGNQTLDDWNDGMAPVLEVLSERWHIYGQHDYMVGGYEGLPDPTVPRDHPWWAGNLIGHHRLAWQAAMMRGLHDPLTATTEIGAAAPEHAGMGWSEEAYADKLIAWDNAVYRLDDVLFQAVFSVGGGGLWEKLDMLHKGAFWARLAEYYHAHPVPAITLPVPGPKPEPEEPMEWKTAILYSRDSDGARVRAEPTVDSPQMARIPPEGIQAEYLPDRERWKSDGAFLWVPVRVDGQAGYVRKDVVILPEDSDASDADIRQLRKELDALRGEVGDIRLRLGRQEHGTEDLRSMLNQAGQIFRGNNPC